MKVNDAYILTNPSNQNIIDIFQNEWSSKFPEFIGLKAEPGSAGLFEDSRVIWAEKTLGSFKNKNILELGPLEGAHSYMLQQRGAASIISIEANTRGYLKCLCVKEIFDLHKVKFLLGDFTKYLKETTNSYDIVFASGVLYHMIEPVELIKLMSKVSDKIMVWTHYYDEDIIKSNKALAHKFDKKRTFKYDGIKYEYSTQEYKDAIGWGGFCGGPRDVSKWLTKESIMLALKTYGFTQIDISFDDKNHPNGPAFAICAVKS